ncbi:hypothetical protein Ancab_007886 [Ancistrocladus abbreviatus]
MGSCVKTNSSSNGGHHMNHRERGRPYAVMLLLAFGAAFLGVLVLHKFRERRVLSVVLQEKDQQLIALHTLLQREREFHGDAKKKLQEMKEKVYPLRANKMELERRLMEMQSTISYLKDEQKALETALQEKMNEIKMLRERNMNSSDEISQVATLREILKQKEAEIEVLRHQLEKIPVKVWSVSTDDPSNPSVNLSTTVSLEENADNTPFQEPSDSTKIAGGEVRIQNETQTHKETKHSTAGEAGKLDNVASDDNTNAREEESRKLEDTNEESKKGQDSPEARSLDENQRNESEVPQAGRGSGITEQKTADGQQTREKDVNMQAMEVRHDQYERLESSQENVGEGQAVVSSSGDGLNLETTGSTEKSSSSRVQRKHKVKRWRELVKSRRRGKNGYADSKGARGRRENLLDDAHEAESTNSTVDEGLQKNDMIENQSVESESKNESLAQDKQRKDTGSSNYLVLNGKQKDPSTDENTEDISTMKLQDTQKSEHVEDRSGDVSVQNKEGTSATQEMTYTSENENVEDNSRAEDGSKQNSNEDNKQTEEQEASESPGKKGSPDANREENNVAQGTEADKEPEDMEDADARVAEAEGGDNIFTESDSKLAEGFEYKEEAEEDEF